MVELVWDGRSRGTITTQFGDEIAVGGDRHLPADDLLAAAVAASLMDAYLRLAGAASQPTLGYVTAAAVSRDDRDDLTVHARVLVSCRGMADTAGITALVEAARRTTALCRLLGDRLTIDVACQAIPDRGSAC